MHEEGWPGRKLGTEEDTMVGVLGRMDGRTYPRLEAEEVGHLETPKGQHVKVPTKGQFYKMENL